MKINLKQVLLDYENEPMTNGEGADKKETTVGRVFINALNAYGPGENPTAEEKNKIFQLSMKVNGKNQTPNFTVDDLNFIKTKVGNAYNALVYGRICEVIDGPVQLDDDQESTES